MNYIFLEGICLYAFLGFIILLLLISIASLICAISADSRNYFLNKLLSEEKRKVKLLVKANFKLKLKYGELDCKNERDMQVYLNMKNPYCFYARDGGIQAQIAEDFQMDEKSISRNDIQSILQSHKYDGILLYASKYAADNDFSTAVVFDSAQIRNR